MEKSKLWMIVIIAVLVLMCAGFVVGFILLSNTIKGQTPTGAGEVTETRNEHVNTDVPEHDLVELAIGDSKVVPLKQSDDLKVHYLKYAFCISLDKTNVEEYNTFNALITGVAAEGGEHGATAAGIGKLAFIQSSVETIIGGYTFEQIQSDQAKPALQEQIVQSLRDHFGTNIIYRCYFSEWLPQ